MRMVRSGRNIGRNDGAHMLKIYAFRLIFVRRMSEGSLGAELQWVWICNERMLLPVVLQSP